ncbi:MAG: hypothetical protein KGL39_09250 [Patescibacteria group bacterium]|nr:hypothetical protein [Patescibacteria group bacterium]
MSTSFPFQQGAGTAIPSIIYWDLIIEEEYPGISMLPTLPSGAYQEIREVNGALWWVTNAMWNPTTAQWEQDSPADASTPAYALEQGADGSFTRYVAPATVVAGTAVVWTAVYAQDGAGNTTIEPTAQTVGALIGLLEKVSWNVGVGVAATARQITVTDTSSSTASLLDNFVVNGTPVWQVRKDGTLVTGKIPASAITNAPQSGFKSGAIPADGSGYTAITFPTAFPTNLTGLSITPSNDYLSNAWGIGFSTWSESRSGFTVAFYGAPAGSTIPGFWWTAFGD